MHNASAENVEIVDNYFFHFFAFNLPIFGHFGLMPSSQGKNDIRSCVFHIRFSPFLPILLFFALFYDDFSLIFPFFASYTLFVHKLSIVFPHFSTVRFPCYKGLFALFHNIHTPYYYDDIYITTTTYQKWPHFRACVPLFTLRSFTVRRFAIL